MADEPQGTTPEVSPETTPQRDYAAELAKKASEVTAQQKEIDDLREQISRFQGDSDEHKAERQRLTLQTADMLVKLGGLETELSEARQANDANLEKLSRATEVVSQGKSDVEARLAAAEAQIAKYEAEKAERQLREERDALVDKEFPQLRRFRNFLPVGKDAAETRALLKQFDEEALAPSMNDLRQVLGGAAGAQPTAPIQAPEVTTDDEDQMRAQLEKAMRDGTFDEVKTQMIQAYEATRRR